MKLSIPGLSLIFKGLNYVTTYITFDFAALQSLTDLNGLVCLDTWCKITLVDRSWLAKKLFSQKISTMFIFLKVRNIGTLRHKSEDFALTTIYIPGIDKNSREIYTSIS